MIENEIENKKEFKLVQKKAPSSLLPNALTILGVCLGLSSIKFALDLNFAMAVVAIGFAAILDTLDGRVARLIKGTSKIGKELGTKGLMPSPRNGTVVNSDSLESAIKQCKSGRAMYKLDSNSNIHSVVGKSSFEDSKIEDNIKDLINTINSSRPSKLKGDFLINIHLASTMGPSIKLDIDSIID